RGAHALGVATHALEEFTHLAATKTPVGATTVLRDQPRVQAAVALAHAQLEAARCYLYGTVAEAWQTAASGARVRSAQTASMRLAYVYYVDQEIALVDSMHRLGEGTAIYATSVLDRCFRDVHTAAADVLVSPRNYESIGQQVLTRRTPAAS